MHDDDPHANGDFERPALPGKVGAYHAFFAPIMSEVVEPLLDAAAVGVDLRVLDVESGPGYVAARAAQRGAHVIGLDASEEMVTLARRLHPAVQFEVGDAHTRAFPPERFDAVVGNCIPHHIAHQLHVLAGLARVLAPHGRIAMTVWDDPSRCRLLGLLADSVRAAEVESPNDLPAGPAISTTDEAYEALLIGAGCRDPYVQTIAYWYRFADSDELWNGLLSAAMRSAARVTEQPPDTQARIREAFDSLLAEYTMPDGLEIPVSVKLFSARR